MFKVRNLYSRQVNNRNENCFLLFDNAYYEGTSENPYQTLKIAKDKTIKSCLIHKDCKYIDESAFEGCKKLKSVSLPEGLIEIGGFAFANCKSLEHIEIPSNISVINISTFSYCKKLKSVCLPENIRYIYGFAFLDCFSLIKINLSKSTKIGPLTFEGGYKICKTTIITKRGKIIEKKGKYYENKISNFK